ncbi:MAG TPA: MoxR family ATPase [Candidatus Dormibacteraeota bacterium]|nr:MoxR family ATPase [Candidatus Dormibacteraeota bacterium]
MNVEPLVLRSELAKAIVGQDEMVDGLLLALIAGGHALLEGTPGLAKTLACTSLACLIGGAFRRVQFTPDLLPSDVVGTRIYDQRAGEFRVELGPAFANLLLADEINRAPAKVQSALLEAMQERQVTIAGETHALPAPFVVLATQNPLDGEGTYPLPVAQLDRFLVKIRVAPPTREQELEIVARYGDHPPTLSAAAALDDVRAWQERARAVHVEPPLRAYAVDLVRATRSHPLIEAGASPRASLALVALARARSVLQGRSFATPDDVRAVAPAALRHRVAWSYRVAAEERDPERELRELVAAVSPP